MHFANRRFRFPSPTFSNYLQDVLPQLSFSISQSFASSLTASFVRRLHHFSLSLSLSLSLALDPSFLSLFPLSLSLSLSCTFLFFLKFCITSPSRERNDIPNVGKSGNKQNEPFKAQSESSVRDGTVFAQI